jgi:hypothetical protein
MSRKKIDSLVAADFNRDGFPDVATSNDFSGDASVLLNTGQRASSTAIAAKFENPGVISSTRFHPGIRPFSATRTKGPATLRLPPRSLRDEILRTISFGCPLTNFHN